MNAQVFTCPRCRNSVAPGSRFCSACGLNFSAIPTSIPKKKNSLLPLWIVLGVLGLCGLCGFIGKLGDMSKNTPQQASTNSTASAGTNAQATPAPTPTPTFAELKSRSQSLVKGGNETDLAEFDAVLGPLRQIPKDSKEYPEAQRLIKQLINKSSVIAAEKLVLGERPTNSPWDGSVRPAEQYLKLALKDYDSSEYLGWTNVNKTYIGKEPYWTTTVRIRAKNSFGAYVVSDIKFYIRGGQVVKVDD